MLTFGSGFKCPFKATAIVFNHPRLMLWNIIQMIALLTAATITTVVLIAIFATLGNFVYGWEQLHITIGEHLQNFKSHSARVPLSMQLLLGLGINAILVLITSIFLVRIMHASLHIARNIFLHAKTSVAYSYAHLANNYAIIFSWSSLSILFGIIAFNETVLSTPAGILTIFMLLGGIFIFPACADDRLTNAYDIVSTALLMTVHNIIGLIGLLVGSILISFLFTLITSPFFALITTLTHRSEPGFFEATIGLILIILLVALQLFFSTIAPVALALAYHEGTSSQ
jgi:hypothetical protein